MSNFFRLNLFLSGCRCNKGLKTAPGEDRTHSLCISHVYKYNALTDCATGAEDAEAKTRLYVVAQEYKIPLWEALGPARKMVTW